VVARGANSAELRQTEDQRGGSPVVTRSECEKLVYGFACMFVRKWIRAGARAAWTPDAD
jgi:hypothetical protein